MKGIVSKSKALLASVGAEHQYSHDDTFDHVDESLKRASLAHLKNPTKLEGGILEIRRKLLHQRSFEPEKPLSSLAPSQPSMSCSLDDYLGDLHDKVTSEIMLNGLSLTAQAIQHDLYQRISTVPKLAMKSTLASTIVQQHRESAAYRDKQKVQDNLSPAQAQLAEGVAALNSKYHPKVDKLFSSHFSQHESYNRFSANCTKYNESIKKHEDIIRPFAKRIQEGEEEKQRSKSTRPSGGLELHDLGPDFSYPKELPPSLPPFPALSFLHQLRSPSPSTSSIVADLWSLSTYLSGENFVMKGTPLLALNPHPHSSLSLRMGMYGIRTLAWLEDHWVKCVCHGRGETDLLKSMISYITEHRIKENGGSSGQSMGSSLASSFSSSSMSSIHASSIVINDVSVDVYVLIFYLLRGGCRNEMRVILGEIKDHYPDIIPYEVFQALEEWTITVEDHIRNVGVCGVTGKTRGALNLLYNNSSETMGEYERMVINCLALSDKDDVSATVCSTMEDYIWLTMCFSSEIHGTFCSYLSQYIDGQTSTFNLPSNSHPCSLSHLRSEITEYGSEHFGESYPLALALSLCFDMAMKVLTTSGAIIDAAHLCIGINLTRGVCGMPAEIGGYLLSRGSSSPSGAIFPSPSLPPSASSGVGCAGYGVYTNKREGSEAEEECLSNENAFYEFYMNGSQPGSGKFKLLAHSTYTDILRQYISQLPNDCDASVAYSLCLSPLQRMMALSTSIVRAVVSRVYEDSTGSGKRRGAQHVDISSFANPMKYSLVNALCQMCLQQDIDEVVLHCCETLYLTRLKDYLNG
ncbi:Nucleoporin interacting component Nup93/Nic96 like protein, partial [Aduncisulcus paluster]